MPRVESSITIRGSLDEVYTLSRDVESFPQFMSDLKSVKVLEKSDDGSRVVSEWVGIVKEFKTTINWVEEDIWDDFAKTCDFRLVRGDYKSYSGRWTFVQVNDSVRFDSVLDFEYEVPLIGALIKNLIARKMKDNLDNMLLAIKEKVEKN